MYLFLSLMAVSTLVTPANSTSLSGNPPIIEVIGQAQVFVKSNNLAISVFIKERGKLADKVRANVEQKTKQVIKVAKTFDIHQDDILSSKITLAIEESKPSIVLSGIDTKQRFETPSFKNKQHNNIYVEAKTLNNQNSTKARYFNFSRTIDITFSTLKDYDQFLNKMMKLGLNHVYLQIVSATVIEKYYQQALKEALANARTKAVNIANYSKVKLGKLMFVKENTKYNYSSYPYAVSSTTQIKSHDNLHLGNQTIGAAVLVKYSIE